jgi:hypothetical protein
MLASMLFATALLAQQPQPGSNVAGDQALRNALKGLQVKMPAPRLDLRKMVATRTPAKCAIPLLEAHAQTNIDPKIVMHPGKTRDDEMVIASSVPACIGVR